MPSAPLAIDVIMNTAARQARTRVRVGDGEAEMMPDEARNFGQQLIGAATEAEIQGFLLDWFAKYVGQLDVRQGTAWRRSFGNTLLPCPSAARNENHEVTMRAAN